MLEFEAPEDWNRVPVRRLAHEKKDRAGESEPPVLSVTKHEGLVLSGEYFSRTVHSRDTSNYKMLEKGDFAYATIHLDEGSIDYLSSDVAETGAVSPMYTVFRVDPEVVQPEFLKLMLRSEQARRIWKRIGRGGVTRRKSISFKVLGKVRVPVPSLAEQRKIAAVLSSVDDAIAATRRVIEQTKRVKQGLLQTLMTRGIGHTRFKKTKIGEIPETWEVVPLGAICQKITDGTHQPVKTVDNGPIPFLYVSSIRDGRINTDGGATITEETYADISPGRESFPGLVLYTAVGSYGHAAVAPDDRQLAFQRHIAYLAPDKGRVMPEYLASFLNSDQGRREADRFAVGNAQKTVTLRDLRDFRIPLPALDEQCEIISAVGAVEGEEEVGRSLIDHLTDLKTGLLQDLLTGRVRVPLD